MYLCAAISKLLIMKRLFISLLAVAMVASGFAAETTLDFSKGTLFCSRFQKKTHHFSPRLFPLLYSSISLPHDAEIWTFLFIDIQNR